MRGTVIRQVRLEDAKALTKIYAPYVRDTAISFEYEPPSADEFARRIAATVERYPYLVAERDGALVGYVYAGPFKTREAYAWAVESSIYVAQGARREGLGSRLYDALERCLKLQGILNLNACLAFTESEDEHLTNASLRFHEARGFSLVGRFHKCGYKFDTWYDMVWLEKNLGEHVCGQPRIVPFGELDQARVGALLASS